MLTARFGADATAIVDAQTSRGALQWRAAGKGKLELVAPGTPPRTSRATATGFGTEQVLALLQRHGALFAADIARRLGRTDQPLTLADVHLALQDLEAAGLIGNDLFERTGRWSAVEDPDKQSREGALEAYAEALLRRYGVVSREVVRAEKYGVSWAELERLLKLWEWRGRAVRGDFVRQLSGPQFARREAVDMLRTQPQPTGGVLLA
ncbi:MAG: hypothetical protein JO247_17100 [Chloroflexi bacterium]|nr:hypothetical protein [Chloroflexota bacterium]